ncbi:MAG TPA: hypothetical protein VE954_29350 [Oligoflexus sp.]|uniref:hypothetical protein n=1 Tax=Oligoflexus sp. TaxID=1971216 RepID=UPI002D3D8C95|nr:hypothetical protein [Oligoflexus sp.]HYX37230.1 hypothetical protein [Oligoflexus sp.]
MFTIQVVNRSNISRDEVALAVNAINQQLLKHFFPAWQIRVVCKVAPVKLELREVDAGAVIFLTNHGRADCQGYHDVVKKTGVPYGFCFVNLLNDEPWSVTLSHEILELALNPYCDAYHLSKHPERHEKRHVFLWREAADPVQCQSYPIKVNRKSVLVSDFVYPNYFTPYSESIGRNNHLDNISSCSLAEGGYLGFYDPLTGDDVTFFARDDLKAFKRFDLKAKAGQYRRRTRTSELIRGIRNKRLEDAGAVLELSV